MSKITEPVYLSVNEMAEDFTNLTGSREYGQAASMAYAIYYRDTVIDTLRYQRGAIDDRALKLSRHVRWEHAKRHNVMLSDNMLAAGRHRPKNVSTHHIVAWDHPRAAKSRIRLAAYAIDIDNEFNGVYLPRYQTHCPHPYLPNAKSHSKTHTEEYFMNVEFLLEGTIAEGLGKNAIMSTLRDVATMLENGKFPLRRKLADG
ncbi:AHH domain-containing protein [Rheinheimera hassiensis]|uniref:AHH domain-containing protein n=1 Tax=Rheinheimera hassiensis TaxID=1193627 RepID=UPI001F059E74